MAFLNTNNGLWSVQSTNESMAYSNYSKFLQFETSIKEQNRLSICKDSSFGYVSENTYNPSNKLFETDSEDSGMVCSSASTHEESSRNVLQEYSFKIQSDKRCCELSFESRFGLLFRKSLPPPIKRTVSEFIYSSGKSSKRRAPLPPIPNKATSLPPLSRAHSSSFLDSKRLRKKFKLGREQLSRRKSFNSKIGSFDVHTNRSNFVKTAPDVLCSKESTFKLRGDACPTYEQNFSTDCSANAKLDTSDFYSVSSIGNSSFSSHTTEYDESSDNSSISNPLDNIHQNSIHKFATIRPYMKIRNNREMTESSSISERSNNLGSPIKSDSKLASLSKILSPKRSLKRTLRNSPIKNFLKSNKNTNLQTSEKNIHNSDEFSKSKSDTALDRMFSEIDYEYSGISEFSSIAKLNESKKVQYIDIDQEIEKIKSMSQNSTRKIKTLSNRMLSPTYSNSSSRLDKFSPEFVTPVKLRKSLYFERNSLKTAASLDCIAGTIKENSFYQNQNRFKDSICGKNSPEMVNSPNILAAKGKVKDLIQRFSSMENLTEKDNLSFQKKPKSLHKKPPHGQEKSSKKYAALCSSRQRKFSTISSAPEDVEQSDSNASDNCDYSSESSSSSCHDDSPFSKMITSAQVNLPENNKIESVSYTMRKDSHNIGSSFLETLPAGAISPNSNFCTSSDSNRSTELFNNKISNSPSSSEENSPMGKFKKSFLNLNKRKSRLSDIFKSSKMDTSKEKSSKELLSMQDCESIKFKDVEKKSKPYVQLKSLRSWREAKKKDKEPKRMSLLSAYTKKRESLENFPADSVSTFDNLENLSKIENLTESTRRMSQQSNCSLSSESWKFDPICSSLISDTEDFNVQDLDRSITYSSYNHKMRSMHSENLSLMNKECDSLESLPFYSRMFRNSKKYFRKAPSSLEFNQNLSKRNYANFPKERRHSLSNPGTDGDYYPNQLKRLTPSALYPLNISSPRASSTSPPLSRRSLLKSSSVPLSPTIYSGLEDRSKMLKYC